MNAPFSPAEAARALGGRVVGGDRVRAPSPGMPPTDESLEIKFGSKYADGFTVNDYYGGDGDWQSLKDYVRDACGKPWEPSQPKDDPVQRMNERAKAKPKLGPIIKAYDYTEADGTLLYQVTRHDPKDFRQRMPDGNGGWIKDLDALNGRRVLYRWPSLVELPDATVFVCEGEKDADRIASFGHRATTVASGKWTDDCIPPLKGRHVFILEDNDVKGNKRALAAAKALHGVAASLRIIQLSDQPRLPDGGLDVSNWLDANNNDIDALIEHCLAAPEWVPPFEHEDAPDDDFSQDPPKSDSTKPEPLKFIDMSLWDAIPVPPRQWAVRDRVPAHQVTLLSGEGGTGKSIIEMQLCAAHVLERDWFGSLPEPGPVIYQGCEDTEGELHRRLASICTHYDVKFAELVRGGLHMFSCVEGDGMLGVPTKSGQIEPTKLYNQMLEAAKDIRPKHIGIDTSADVFGGNEIDRAQVRQFVSMLRKLAIAANGSVVLLSHPSLTGISTGTGLSGSTAWHNSVRSRIYLKAEGDTRTLQFMKNQYGLLGESVVVRYDNGVFKPDGGKTDVELALVNKLADDKFLELLDITALQLRFFGAQKGTNFAPAQLAKLEKAKGHTAKTLADAMERLLAAGKIKLVPNPTKRESKATLVLMRAGT